MALNEKLQKDDGAEKMDVKFYRSLVGCLFYLTNNMLDIVFIVMFLDSHTAAKRILHYLGIKYVK